MKEQFSAGVVIYRKAQQGYEYLIIQHACTASHWDFPKGKIEPGETLQEAALREAHEETGFTVKIDPGFEERIAYDFMHYDDRIIKIVHFFMGQIVGGVLTLSSEHINAQWLSFDEALEKVTYPTAKDVLRAVNTKLMNR